MPSKLHPPKHVLTSYLNLSVSMTNLSFTTACYNIYTCSKTLSTITTKQDRGLPHSVMTGESAKAQICRTRAEPQQIVATRLLYCLQHSVLFKSSAKDSPPPIFHFNSWTSNTDLSVNATEPTRYGSQPKPI